MPRASFGKQEPYWVVYTDGLELHIFPTHVRVEVPSSKGDGLTYLVSLTKDFATCECPSYGYRGRCSHITKVSNTAKLFS